MPEPKIDARGRSEPGEHSVAVVGHAKSAHEGLPENRRSQPPPVPNPRVRSACGSAEPGTGGRFPLLGHVLHRPRSHAVLHREADPRRGPSSARRWSLRMVHVRATLCGSGLREEPESLMWAHLVVRLSLLLSVVLVWGLTGPSSAVTEPDPVG